MRDKASRVNALQEDIGLDVLVHGGAGRGDMVRSYGSRQDPRVRRGRPALRKPGVPGQAATTASAMSWTAPAGSLAGCACARLAPQA
jgi:hypothetical protein